MIWWMPKVAMRVIEDLYDGVSTSELDNLAAETAASMTIAIYYELVAARIAISNCIPIQQNHFRKQMNEMFEYVNQEMDNMLR
jgi:ribonucleoside-diphosphate reductase alpha chain